MKLEMSLAAVSMKTALKYRRDWNKNGPTVKILRKFMPMGSKDYRVYFPLGSKLQPKPKVVAPLSVRRAVAKAGYRITDYLAKKCVKLKDKEQKNFFNIGKVIASDPVAKMAFDNDPHLQNSNRTDYQMVVSCHPYDIIGMSTGRDWDLASCMRLTDTLAGTQEGSNADRVTSDVAEGTIVVYAIHSNDTNIKQPLGRCLLKPFIHGDGKSLMYRRETRIYGNPVPGFAQSIDIFLRKLNTNLPDGEYVLKEGLYDDGVGNRAQKDTDNRINWENDARRTLQQYPERFMEFVKYTVESIKKEPQHRDQRMAYMLTNMKGVPTNILKHAGRFVSADKENVDSMIGRLLTSSANGTAGFAAFVSSKEMQEAIKKNFLDSAPASITRLVRRKPSLTYLSKDLAKAFFDGYEDNQENAVRFSAMALRDNLRLEVSEVVKHPVLHRILLKMAKDIHEASAFDVPLDQAYAYKYMAVLPEIEEPEYDELMHIGARYSESSTIADYTLIAAALLAFRREGNDEMTERYLGFLGADGLYALFHNPRLRRRLFRTKFNDEQKGRFESALHPWLTGIGAGEVSQAVGRDIVAYVKTFAYEASALMEILPMLEFDPTAMQGAYVGPNSSSLLRQLASENVRMRKVLEKCGDIKPRNESQQMFLNAVGMMQSIQKDGVSIPFEFDMSGPLEELTHSNVPLHRLNIDYGSYPQLLSDQILYDLLPPDFLGTDNGKMMKESLVKRFGVAKAVNNIANIFRGAGEASAFLLARGVVNNSYNAVAHLLPQLLMDEAQAQAAINRYAEYAAKLAPFVNSIPESNDPQRYDKLAKWLGVELADVDNDAVRQDLDNLIRIADNAKMEMKAVIELVKSKGDQRNLDTSALRPFM